jgi:hypothetical protein
VQASNILKKKLCIPVEILGEDEKLKCQALDVSMRGLLAEPLSKQFEATDRFHSFFGNREHERVITVLGAGKARELSLPAHLAFAELTPDDKVRQVGLRFLKLSPNQKEILKHVLSG